ncbi:MAG: hypothetical protein MPJ50_09375 [Pirellulales bacterium]|nr:hypothetical protein [Pirellulales bacterium]
MRTVSFALRLRSLSYKFAGLVAIVSGMFWFAAWSSGQRSEQMRPVNIAQERQRQSGTSQEEQPQPQIPAIKDEPKTVDPAAFVPAALAKLVTVDFSDSSLREVADWLQAEQGITTLFDSNALVTEGIPQGEPVSDRLASEPLYLMLNRLQSKGLTWYVEDDVLNITTNEVAEERMSTQSYSVGDLLDNGYEVNELLESLRLMTSGGWLSTGTGPGTLELLGDILFVRQGDMQQREIAGFLQALRAHSKRTFAFDPPQHIAIRSRLKEQASVDFDGTPLVTAVAELAAATGVGIRLDTKGLQESGVRDREPVTLKLLDRKFSTILHVLVARLKLDWMLQDGVLWITSHDRAVANLKTSLYDVRDLCQSAQESSALSDAIQSQTKDSWFDDGTGFGRIYFPRVGVMAIRQTEQMHNEVLQLLTMYRQALASAEPRGHEPDPSQDILTYYYRLPTNVALDMATKLPQLVAKGTWQDNNNPDLPGEIVRLESPPELIGADGFSVVTAGDSELNEYALVVKQQILMITQTRENHEKVARLIKRIRKGEEPLLGGFGGGGAGFGGGYFAPKPKPQP